MSTGKWIVLAWCAVEALIQISYVGKVREPKTPSDAIWGVIELGIIAWLVVIL